MRNIYYRIWQLFGRIPTNSMPATNAIIFLTLFQVLNLFAIGIILGYYSIIDIPEYSRDEATLLIAPLFLFVLWINYVFLYKKRDKLHDKYKTETKKQKIIGIIVMAIYILVSIALIAYFGPKYTEFYLATKK